MGYGGYFLATNATGPNVGIYGQARGNGNSNDNKSWGVAGHHYWFGTGVGAWSYGGNLIEGYSGDYPTGTLRFYVTNNGTAYADGGFSTYAKADGDVENQYRSLSTIASSEEWYEDFGSATLEGGQAAVTIEPVFASLVNLMVEYHVFVSPICDQPVVLFVSDKKATGFTVQGVSLDGKLSQCAFEYRIVAKPIGSDNTRLETINLPEPVIVERETNTLLDKPAEQTPMQTETINPEEPN